MGAAVPYAIAAKFAHPGRPVIALVGDGAMQMNNMAELITVAKYYKHLDHADLDLLRLQQRGPQPGDLGAADHGRHAPLRRHPVPAQHRPTTKFGELIGLKGIYVDDPKDLGAAWDQALASPIPVVLEVKTDREVPPLPPHITLEQAKKFMNTIQQGDSGRGRA